MSKTESTQGDAMTGLDWKSQEILVALYENGGTANTTDLRALTGIDDNAIIIYRHNNKLAPRGLIELEQPQTDGTHIAPKVATLTSTGETVAERILDSRDEEHTTISDYAAQLEAKINQLETRLDELETDERRHADQEQDAIAATVEQVTASKYGAWSDESTQQFSEVLFGMLALRDYLLEEGDLTRDELDARMAEAQTALETDQNLN
jgi:hypothetical protein